MQKVPRQGSFSTDLKCFAEASTAPQDKLKVTTLSSWMRGGILFLGEEKIFHILLGWDFKLSLTDFNNQILLDWIDASMNIL